MSSCLSPYSLIPFSLKSELDWRRGEENVGFKVRGERILGIKNVTEIRSVLKGDMYIFVDL